MQPTAQAVGCQIANEPAPAGRKNDRPISRPSPDGEFSSPKARQGTKEETAPKEHHETPPPIAANRSTRNRLKSSFIRANP